MIVAAILAAFTLQTPTARLCVFDAVSSLPLGGATLVYQGKAQVIPDACAMVAKGEVSIRRLGYRMQEIAVAGDTDVFLVPVSAASVDTVHVRARGAIAGMRNSPDMSSDDARSMGASSTSELLSLLPFTQLQQRQGSSTLSLRGARREQTVVTLDGVIMNDPATGLADVNELPLGFIGSARVIPGASGTAVGGVLALQSSTAPFAFVRVGSFGDQSGGFSVRTTAFNRLFQLGGTWEENANDFSFVNSAATSDIKPVEQRINSDRSRISLSGSVLGERWRLSTIMSREEKGMAGAMNVHTYDQDRAKTTRVTVIPQLQFGEVGVRGALRYLDLSYKDPLRPSLDYDAQATAGSLDADWHRVGLDFAAGAGADDLAASGAVSQSRERGYISASASRAVAGWRVDAGARLDAVTGLPVTPSFNAGLSRRLAGQGSGDGAGNGVINDASNNPGSGLGNRGIRALTVRALVSQSVRAPTLYDLYFSSPQRITVKPLKAERVLFDAEAGAALEAATGALSISADIALVSRRVRDAIVWFPGNFGWSPANTGTEVMYGTEARARLQYDSVVLESWGSWYDSELQSGALRIPVPYVPRASGGARISAPLPAIGLVTVNARYAGMRPFTVGPRDPDWELPASTLMDAALSRSFRMHAVATTVTASVRNLTDITWQSVRGFPEPGRSFSIALHLVPHFTPLTSH